MSLLSHIELVELLDTGVVEGGQYSAINSASIDIHLGKTILTEVTTNNPVVDFRKREKLPMLEIVLDEDGYVLAPREFILASTIEKFNLPSDISAEYKLKSSMARIGLEHLNAGWCDAGWNGSVLTLELINVSRHHIRIRPGDAIGQMIFFRHRGVPVGKDYSARGRYNNDATVQGIKV